MLWSSSHISQIVKAQRYLAEPWRFSWQGPNEVALHGSHHAHTLTRDQDGEWDCSCSYASQSYLPCSHVRALQVLLEANHQESGFPEANLSPAFQVGA